MDTIKPNKFLIEVEAMLKTLGLDVEQARRIVPNGVLLYFNFNDIPLYVCLPDQLPSTYSSICRIEAEVAELEETEAARLIYRVSLYLPINDTMPVRIVAARNVKGQKIKVFVQFVADLEMFRPGSVASILLHCCELADELRSEMVYQSQSKAA